MSKLTESPHELSPYYGPLLGSPVAFVRDFAAKSFIIVVRKLSNKAFKDHLKKLIKTCSASISQGLGSESQYQALINEYFVLDEDTEAMDEDRLVGMPKPRDSDMHKRSRWILEGVSLLVFYSCKGITGMMHSKGGQKLESIVRILISLSEPHAKDKASSSSSSSSSSCQLSFGGVLLYLTIKRLQEHLFSEHQKDLLLIVQPLCEAHANMSEVLPEAKSAGSAKGSQSSEEAVSLVNTVLSLKLNLMLTLLSGRKGKTVRCLDNALLNRFIDMILATCQACQFLQVERKVASEANILWTRKAISDLWIAFPTNKVVLSQVEPIVASQAIVVQPSIGMTYFVDTLVRQLPHSILVPHLIPVLLSSLLTLHSSMATLEWLSVLHHFLVSARNCRPDLERLREDTLNLKSMAISHAYSVDIEMDDDLRHCAELVADCVQRCVKKLNLAKHKKKSGEDGQSAKKSKKASTTESVEEKEDKDGEAGAKQELRLASRLMSWFAVSMYDDCQELLKPIRSLLSSAVDDFVRNASPASRGLLEYPEVVIMFCDMVDCSADAAAARQITDLIKAFATHYAAEAPTIGSMVVLNALLHKIGSSVEDSPRYLLSSSLLTAAQQSALMSNLAFALSTPSFWLKMQVLQVLSHFEPPVDDARSKRQSSEYEHNMDDQPPVVLDVVALAFQCVLYPLDLGYEREITRRLEMLEVYCRGTKLPEGFLAIAAGFCIGFLNAKFKPLWSACIQVLLTISQTAAGEEILWRMLQQFFNSSGSAALLQNAHQAPLSVGAGENRHDDDGRKGSIEGLLSSLEDLSQVDSGLVEIPTRLAQSSVFWYHISDETVSMSAVSLDARAENDSVYSSIFLLLQKGPHITLKRSRIVVNAFLQFLRKQFYVMFPDEPEISSLNRFGLFLAEDEELNEDVAFMTMKQVRGRLEAFLTAFAAVPSPRQLHKHQLLYLIYGELLCKADPTLSKQALECILTYKQVEIVPYKERLRRLFDEKRFRDELIVLSTLKASAAGEAEDGETQVKEEHKAELFPLVIRILFGRLIAKSGGKRNSRELASSRRAAVLSFLSILEPVYTEQLLYLMIRGILPVEHINTSDVAATVQFKHNVSDMHTVSAELHNGFQTNLQSFMAIDSSSLSRVYWDKLIGFLYLLEPTLSVLGLSLTQHARLLYRVLEQMLVYAHSFKSFQTSQSVEEGDADREEGNNENDEEQDEVDEAKDEVDDEAEDQAVGSHSREAKKQTEIANDGKFSANVRTMCLQRMTGMMVFLHSTFDFAKHCGTFFDTILPLVKALPSAMISARRPPALLLLLDHTSRYESCMPLLVRDCATLSSIITCVSVAGVNINVSRMVVEILSRVLETSEGRWLRPHAEELVVMFSRRFVKNQGRESLAEETTGDKAASAGEERELKLADVVVADVQTIRMELSFLCQVGSLLFADTSLEINSLAASNLATLVLGMLRVYAFSGRRMRASEEWIVNVLQIFKSLSWRIADASSHAGFVSRLFGPSTGAFSLFDSSIVRREMTAVYQTLAMHPSVSKVLTPLSAMITDMTKQDEAVLDSRDYNHLIPIFQALGDATASGSMSWSSVMGPASWIASGASSVRRPITSHLHISSAVLYETLRCMYDTEMFVRRAALAALKQLVLQCVQWDLSSKEEAEAQEEEEADVHNGWLNLFQAVLIPAMRRAMSYGNDSVKCGFMALLAHMVRVFHTVPKLADLELYHVDMYQLVHQDPEQDFFENITHIQVHRRAKALSKLRALLLPRDGSKMEGGEGRPQSTIQLRVPSLVRVLLPLCFHYLRSDEYQKKLHLPILEEASRFMGAAALHLPWNHYFGVVRQLIQMLSKAGEEKERLVQTALCAVLDAFHFDMTEVNVGGVAINPDELLGEVAVDLSHDVVEGEVEVRADRGVEADDDEDEDEDAEERGAGVDDAVKEGSIVQASIPSSSHAQSQASVDRSSSIIRNKTAVCVVRKIIPWLKQEMVKEVKDQKGKKTEKIQTGIALAIANLIKHLEPPIVTAETRIGLFSNIVISIVNTLKSRDVKVRDVARTSLAKMIRIIGLGALRPVIFELRSNLLEGYQRHVSNYTVRSLLSSVIEDYTPPADAPLIDMDVVDDLSSLQQSFHPLIPAFDSAIPFIMSAVLEDLSEEVREEREVDGVIKSVIREQKGSKYTEILEMVGRCALFRPTYALLRPDKPESVSSIHAVVGPLLSGLQTAESTLVYNRMAEALSRLAAGLAKNTSVQDKELLVYLHSTLQPFIGQMVVEHRRYKRKMGRVVQKHSSGKVEEELSDMESGLPSYLTDELEGEEGGELTFIRDIHQHAASEDKLGKGKAKDKAGRELSQQAPRQWLPAEWTVLKGQRAVIEERNRLQKEQFQVLDGANAPKLTGKNRYDKLMLSKGNHNATTLGVSRSTLLAIKFCLSLFHSSLRKGVLRARDADIQSMVQPFLPLLKSFLYITGASDVLILAIKCTGALISWGVDLAPSMAAEFASKILKIMVRHGATITMDNDLCQSCIQVLVAIFKRHNEERRRQGDQAKRAFPLSEGELRGLVEMMTVSISTVTSSFQNMSFQLIKEIVRGRVMLPEIYDLVVKLTEQIVLAHRKGIRTAASGITVTFFLTYPMSQARAESHFKQLINICDYEYEEGRTAALMTLLAVIRALPVPVLQEYSQMIFLALTLKLVNEQSAHCRDAVVNILSALVSRCEEDYQKVFYGYATKWLQAMTPGMGSSVILEDKVMLVRIGAQSLAIFLKSASEALLKSSTVSVKAVLGKVYTLLAYFLVCEETAVTRNEISKLVWNAIYHLLLLTEQLYSCQGAATDHALTHQDGEELRPAVLAHYQHTARDIYLRFQSSCFLDLVLELTLYPHPWVRASATRLLLQYLSVRQEKGKNRPRLALYKDGVEMLSKPNAFYRVARVLCVQLNQARLPAVLEQAAASATHTLMELMVRHVDLDVYALTSGAKGEDENEEEDEQRQLPWSFDSATGEYREADGDNEEDGEQGDSGEHSEPTADQGEEVENIIYTIDHADELLAEEPALLEDRAGEEEEGKEDEEDDEGEASGRTKAVKRRPIALPSSSSSSQAPAPSSSKKLKMDVLDSTLASEVLAGPSEMSAEPSGESKRGLTWIVQRLRAIGADVRGNRRRHVLQVLRLVMQSTACLEGLRRYLSVIMEVPVRVVMGSNSSTLQSTADGLDHDLQTLAQEVLSLLEQRLGSSVFTQVYAQVQTRLQSIKSERKRQQRIEAITNPRAFAQRKVRWDTRALMICRLGCMHV